MEYIAHRVNTREELIKLPMEYGVELDLRDNLEGKIYIQHDPFQDGEDFENYLKEYHHQTMVLNIKSERIEPMVIQMIKKYNVNYYFFLDSTFPMIKLLSDSGERHIAIRYSEYEGIDTLRAMAGKVEWTWVDAFTRLPMNNKIYNEIKRLGYKVCLVSPELQGKPEKIITYAGQIKNENIMPDAICTKAYKIDMWKELLKE